MNKLILFFTQLFSSLAFYVLAGIALANETPTPTTSTLAPECVLAMQNLYRFYYYEIQPNPKYEAYSGVPNQLSASENAQMQIVIGALKTHCPTDVIAQINQNLNPGQAAS